MNGHSTQFEFKHVKHITKKNFKDSGELKEDLSTGIITVMCYAGWCGHCLNAKPVYDDICSMTVCTNSVLCAIDCANNKDGLVDFLNSKNKKKYSEGLIRGYPTFIQFKNGKFNRRFEDSPQNKEKLLSFILGN